MPRLWLGKVSYLKNWIRRGGGTGDCWVQGLSGGIVVVDPGREGGRRLGWGSETLKFWWELRCNMGQEESPSQGERP